MKPKTLCCSLLLCASMGVSSAWAQDARRPSTASAEKLGSVHFPVSCTAAAQQQFDHAMALYHSFYWPEVKKAFDAVLKADPDCAMAYWGHAMVLLDNPFLWPLTSKKLPQGLAMIDKAKAASAKTQRERDYIAALERFYKDYDRLDHETRVAA